MKRTGKTFRKVLYAVAQASEGQDVIFVCFSQAQVNYALKMASDIVHVAGVKCASYGHSSIKFMEAGIVTFVTTGMLDVMKMAGQYKGRGAVVEVFDYSE
jgi:hypothetical protein